MNLRRELANLNFEDVLPSVTFLQEKGLVIEDKKLFDQFQYLKQFVAAQHEDKFFEQLVHLRWIDFF